MEQYLNIGIIFNPLDVTSVLNPTSFSSLQLFPVSLTGGCSGLEGQADLLGLPPQRGRAPRVHENIFVCLTQHIHEGTECMSMFIQLIIQAVSFSSHT